MEARPGRIPLVLWSVILVASAPSRAQETDWHVFENRGFAAVDEERWCEAARAFQGADRLHPDVDLLLNAAQSATGSAPRLITIDCSGQEQLRM